MVERRRSETLTVTAWPFLGPPEAHDELGRLGTYRVLKLLGQGGMGLVFLAEDRQLRRQVALKVLRPEYAAAERPRARFLREARAAAALKHDHVITIYQVGEDRGIPFLAMELLKGKSLESWLQPKRRPSVLEMLHIARHVTKGLAAAHAKGLIHRDIKPDNIWLEAPSGRVKILDFGLARLERDDATPLTAPNVIIGTPAYMAPEQAHGQPLDGRCDLFSLGCVLYRLCVGRGPFQGPTNVATLAALVTNTPVPVQELNPMVPPRIADLTMRLLAKDPNDRPPSAAAVLEELQDIEQEWKQWQTAAEALADPSPFADLGDPHPPLVPRRQPLAWPAATALGGFVLVAVLGAWALRQGGKPVAVDRPAATGSAAQKVPALPPVASSTTVPQPAVPPAKDGETPVDLLKHVQLDRDIRMGKWSLDSGRLKGEGETEKGFFCLILPRDPPPQYCLRFQARRVQGGYALHIGLAAGQERFTVWLDQPLMEGQGRVHGLSHLDGKHLREREEVGSKMFLKKDIPAQVVCTVQTDGVQVTCDGEVACKWQGDFRRLSRRPNDTNAALYLGGYGLTAFEFEEVILDPLGVAPGKPRADDEKGKGR